MAALAKVEINNSLIRQLKNAQVYEVKVKSELVASHKIQRIIDEDQQLLADVKRLVADMATEIEAKQADHPLEPEL